MQTIRIGTRGSKLALYQAYRVKDELEKAYPGISFEIVIIKTKGDIILDVPLSKIGDKGLFTKELETAMFNNEIDMAVHSLKDLPTTFPEGAKLGAVLKRGDVRDALISSGNRKLSDLTSEDIIATSSLRRKAQLLKINKDFKIVEIRGNVNTRIRKMQEGFCDVMIMAAAGLQRLEMDEFISELIDPEVMIPACSQGAIAIEIRDNDAFIEDLLSKINDSETFITTAAERAFLKTLEGGCQIPVGSFSKIEGNQFHITGFISNIDGSQFLKESATAEIENAVEISVSIAKKLYANGGREILEAIRDLNLAAPKLELPLKDKVIISTRAVESGDNLPELLKSQGAEVIVFPMIEVCPAVLNSVETAMLNKLDQFNWLFFTSKNGVLNFFKQLSDLKGSTALPQHIKIAVIGSKTASELDYYGYAPDFISNGNTSDDFLKEFYKSVNPENQKILLSLGNLAEDTLYERLKKENNVQRINVYQTNKPKTVDNKIINLIRDKKFDLIIFTSPSCFHHFCLYVEQDVIRNLKMASIGSTTTKAIEDEGYTVALTASRSNVEGLVEAITEYYKK